MRVYKLKALFKLGIEDLVKNMNVFVYIFQRMDDICIRTWILYQKILYSLFVWY